MLRLNHYDVEELKKIVVRSAGLLGVKVEAGGTEEIAKRSRGTPRIANNLVRWVRDFVQVKEGGRSITGELADAALKMLDIDESGLDEMDNRLMEALLFKFKGGPVGVKTLAVALGEEESTLEDVYEPYLIQEGYLMRTPQGRVATDKAARRFGVTLSARKHRLTQPGLFTDQVVESMDEA